VVFDLPQYATSIVQTIESAMLGLHARGARHFLVPNAWDRLVTPFSYYQESEADRARISALTTLFNTKLEEMLDDFPGFVYQVDAFGLSRELNENPEGFGFHKGSYGICGSWKDYCPGYIYRDRIHPTSATEWLIANRALQAIPEPGTGLLVAVGLVLMARIRR
jgi:phospholipase/lecithinase/hemolysin